MKKIPIKEEEYQEVLQKLENITQQKQLLKEQYHQYLISTPKSIDKLSQLILSLTKTNNTLTEEIQLEKKKLISTFLPVYTSKEKLIILLENWINNYIYALNLNTTMQELSIEDPIFFNKNPNFETFKQNLTNIIHKQEQIQILLNQIDMLLNEEKELLTQKKRWKRAKSKK